MSPYNTFIGWYYQADISEQLKLGSEVIFEFFSIFGDKDVTDIADAAWEISKIFVH